MKDPKILTLQENLLACGFDPGTLDGIKGPNTQKAIERMWAVYPTMPNFEPLQSEFVANIAKTKRVTLAHPSIIKVQGVSATTKPTKRHIAKPVFIQVHQTDYWPKEKCLNMKTNLYVSTEHVYEVHPFDTIIVDNYNDFYHIEVAWVSASRRHVTHKGKTYDREAGIWTQERAALLETAIVYSVLGFRAHSLEPTIITHCQTYGSRAIDPDKEIAQASYSIAKKHGFRLDFDFVRGSGSSAKKWYPEGCGKLG